MGVARPLPRAMTAAGLKAQFVQGMRVTDEKNSRGRGAGFIA